MEMKWTRAETGTINEPIIDYLEKLIEKELEFGNKLIVCIGTDAQRRGRGHKFVTVITLVTEGKGGKIMYTVEYDKNKMTLNQKLLKEVYKSIEIAYNINPLLELYGVKLEIHVDINPDDKWASNKSMSQAVGYIMGMGYAYKTKPDAFAASFNADKYAKQ
jgi:predicted RNase H-related nuclease YkuK (DUF458 family)